MNIVKVSNFAPCVACATRKTDNPLVFLRTDEHVKYFVSGYSQLYLFQCIKQRKYILIQQAPSYLTMTVMDIGHIAKKGWLQLKLYIDPGIVDS